MRPFWDTSVCLLQAAHLSSASILSLDSQFVLFFWSGLHFWFGRTCLLTLTHSQSWTFTAVRLRLDEVFFMCSLDQMLHISVDVQQGFLLITPAYRNWLTITRDVTARLLAKAPCRFSAVMWVFIFAFLPRRRSLSSWSFLALPDLPQFPLTVTFHGISYSENCKAESSFTRTRSLNMHWLPKEAWGYVVMIFEESDFTRWHFMRTTSHPLYRSKQVSFSLTNRCAPRDSRFILFCFYNRETWSDRTLTFKGSLSSLFSFNVTLYSYLSVADGYCSRSHHVVCLKFVCKRMKRRYWDTANVCRLHQNSSENHEWAAELAYRGFPNIPVMWCFNFDF